MRVHFGDFPSTPCSDNDIKDANSGKLAYLIKGDDALYPYDTKALIPSCLIKGTDKDHPDKIVYKQGENIWLWVSVGLAGLVILILLFSALRGGGGGGGPGNTIVYR